MKILLYQSFKNKIKNLLLPSKSLYQKTLHSGIWTFALRGTTQVLNIIRTIILARLLSPVDFGLIGIALMSLNALDVLTQTGYQQALIQKKDNIEDYLDTSWTIMLLRNIIICLMLFFSAPFIASFFRTFGVKSIIQIIGLSFLFGGTGGLGGFINIGIIYFQKELDFKKQFIWYISGTLVDFTVSIFATLILKNVWALVYGLIAGNCIRLIMSYLLVSYRPCLKIDFIKSRELFKYGKWIGGSSFLSFLLTNIDNIFVGRFLNATALGFYQMAYNISNIPATEITNVISQVTFPAYAKIQDDITSLKSAYLKVIKLTSYISFLIAGLIFVLASEFTTIFLGDKWISMVLAIKILVCYGVLRSLIGAISPVFMSIGRPDILTKMQFIQTILLLILLYPLTARWNISGTSIAVLISGLTLFFIRNQSIIKILNFKFLEFYKSIFIPFNFVLISVLIVILFKTIFLSLDLLYTFIISIIIYLLTYLLQTIIADKYFKYHLIKLIKECFNSI